MGYPTILHASASPCSRRHRLRRADRPGWAPERKVEGTPVPATYADHRAQLKAILRGWGMPEDNAEITAEVLAWSDLHGIDSHGISMIPRYDELRRNGRVRMGARPRIVSQTPVSAAVGSVTCRRISPCRR